MKRIGNLGELAVEQFCREYLPVEMWEWENEEAIQRCNSESFSGHDFEVFGYTVDVKSSRDVSAFLPESLVERDPIRRGYITQLLRAGVPVEIVSDRCNVSPTIIDQHYDVRSKEDKMQQRQEVLGKVQGRGSSYT